jgi:predicted nucleic-acid-binding protein
MLAIDTNVVVRCLVDEDPEQCRRARSLVSSRTVFLSTTVLLETEWVLRGVFALQQSDILAALRKFFSLPTIVLEDGQAAFRACAWAERGMDFADALHLASSANCEAFVSFDKGLAKAAAKLGAIKVRAP